MFFIFVCGSLFIPNSADIASAVFAFATLLFWIIDGYIETITKGDAVFTFIFFIIAICIRIIRRKILISEVD